MGWYDRKVRRVRDLSCGDTRIYLELEVRRIDCRRCERSTSSAHSDDRDQLIPTDRDQLFRSIATRAARVLRAPLDDGGDVSLLWVGQARREAVPVVNRRDPRATRSAPWLTQRRAREVPVDPPGRAGSWARALISGLLLPAWARLRFWRLVCGWSRLGLPVRWL